MLSDIQVLTARQFLQIRNVFNPPAVSHCYSDIAQQPGVLSSRDG
jgi:hypothetical protein